MSLAVAGRKRQTVQTARHLPECYDCVCLNGPHGWLIRVLVSECDFEDCDVTSLTS